MIGLLLLSLVAWVFLLTGRRGFWRASPAIEDEPTPDLDDGPPVAAVVPARNEAATVRAALTSILRQDYPGRLRVVLVDDQSTDDTGRIAEALASASDGRLEVIGAPPLPPGWSGKLWAVRTGLAEVPDDVPLVWLTDADIGHDTQTLRRLVAKAERDRLDLVSLMVRLDTETWIERLLIPPFVFFFQKLYPFRAVNDPASGVAAAAGGCALVRRGALEAAGGIEAIRDELIDDVALARAIKHRAGGGHAIWLGHGRLEQSLRRYARLGEVWDMVARSADEQLGHSLTLLALTIAGMALLYLVPVLGLLIGLLGGGSALGV
ncbi:MAG: glycosyltransferase, partial [Geminicoccaceae bacterium]|nr:glycosyltransferase [Geminicoccaceae bacterium]